MPELHCQILGKGRPLILLHGWGWHSGIFNPLIPYLQENFQLFLIDLPGFGKSPLLSEDYDIHAISAAILKIAPPEAIFAGWSLGGMIAWFIALHHPGRVAHLVTIASSPKWVSDHDWPGVSAPTLDQFSRCLIQDTQKTLRDFLALQWRGASKNPETIDRLNQQIIASSSSVPALSGGLKLLRELDLRPTRSTLHCPSLHILGSHDTLVPVSIIEKMRPFMPHATFSIIRRAGHMPFLSHSELFLQTLREFL
ncbi:MAG TPA: pimeloyl-ACP methyl ester esterase BioH [Gammaproteobacteria bacterium]|nr:pimeloyl-ACP methyl ester esterase BioH [Gammaproteobacteria bacterium]